MGATERLPGTEAEKDKGRRDAEGIQKPIKITPIKEGVKELMKLYNKVTSARTKYNDGVKVLAKSGNVSASTLNKLIRASAGGNFKDVKHELDQQQEIFDAVGEVPGGSKAAEGGE